MTPFEYLSVLLSIILGLAITQVLQGYRGLLLARGRVRRHLPSLIWSALILLFACQGWWASFGLERHDEWRFEVFLVIVLQMGLLYVLAALVLPDVPEGAHIDLEAHYEAQRRPFFSALLLALAASLLKDLMLEGELPETLNVLFHLFFAAVALCGLLSRKYTMQLAAALLASAGFVVYTALLFARLEL